ncbi:MAG: response regulator [Planctomycetota bacterium]
MKVLIIDDSKVMRQIVMRTLRQSGFDSHQFVEAGDGMEAQSIINAVSPDLILSDWNMPEMNGIELLTTLRSQGNAIRFGFVTSETTPAMRQEAKDAGALFMIAKPFTVESFKEALSSILG